MKKLLYLFAGIGTMCMLGVSGFAAPAAAVNCSGSSSNPLCKAKSGSNKVGGSNKSNSKSLTSRIHNIINLVIYAIGIIAVIMIVIGGIRYTTSGGEQAQMSAAKNTIMYAIVGLIIAVLAYAIVGFVVNML